MPGTDSDSSDPTSLSYYMSIQPNASLTKIGLAAPVSTAVGICLNIGFFLWLNRKSAKKVGQ